MFFFSRESIICINKKKVYRISTKTNNVETLQLDDPIQILGSNVLLDGSFYYFLCKGQDENTKLACLSIDMIEAQIAYAKSQESNAFDDDKPLTATKLNYPSWDFCQAKKLDYDEFNGTINLLTYNLEVILKPIAHRNVLNFMGMAERSFYLARKQVGDTMYALDKQNFLN
jgi:hypothetical protein